jgi:hypothetical protein
MPGKLEYLLFTAAVGLFASLTPLKALATPSKVVSREIQSVNFAQSKIGVSPIDGRFYNEVLPFFKKHLVFDVSTASNSN